MKIFLRLSVSFLPKGSQEQRRVNRRNLVELNIFPVVYSVEGCFMISFIELPTRERNLLNFSPKKDFSEMSNIFPFAS